MHGFPRLFIGAQFDDLSQLWLDGQQFSEAVTSRSKRMPCLTTPAPDDKGRPAPKKTKGKTDEATRNRWLQANRQYAPWHYEQDSMMKTQDGELVTPSIEAKEQFHHLPYGYTGAAGAQSRERRKMMGNSWHLGVAKFLLWFVLQWPAAGSIPSPPSRSTLQFMIDHTRPFHATIGPGPWVNSEFMMPPSSSMLDHWQKAQECAHPLMMPTPLEPGLQAATQRMMLLWSDISRLRYEVVDDVMQLVEDFGQQTDRWWHALPSHVQQVYDHKEDENITQVPVLLYLLEQCGYPGLSDLAEDLHYGFNIIGPQHSGPGWLPRLDGRYSSPLDLPTFVRVNQQHVFERLLQPRVDPHWQVMLQELLSDREQGKLTGPYSAPTSWPVPTVTVENLELLQAPAGLICPATSFSVVQSDKVRRCEDYRRSWHNATVQVGDIPHHHTIETYSSLARQWLQRAGDCTTWAHDMDAAYRQLAVRDVQFSFVLLTTPFGHTLWRHNALCFGATASVWAFNRVADSVMHIGRQLLAAPILHYVDDFGGCEPTETATSTFECFAKLSATLGLKMKSKKACAPQHRLKMLGVWIRCNKTEVVLEPCPDRVQRLHTIIKDSLASNTLTPEDAQRLSGKLIFLHTTSFGQVGKAALQPVYSRAAQQDVHHCSLNFSLRAALVTILSILKQMSPRVIPVSFTEPVGIVYTDAFFSPGDGNHKMKPHQATTHWSPSLLAHADHGWGLVLTIRGRTIFTYGRAPTSLVQRYGKRKAFIYFLELLAPILLISTLNRKLPRFLIAFIDNQAGLQAIQKGYGSDPAVNGMLTFFWALVARLGLFIHFEWVPSELNISDPISRRDLTMAHDLAWHETPFELEPIYSILMRCAADLDYASSIAVDECLALPLSWFEEASSCKVGS